MLPSTSFFLDALRLTAAIVVFAVHCVVFWNPEHTVAAGRAAHGAVIVFFVLSGYVIAHATLRRETTPRAYVLARLSRLYSVLIPALLLTVILQAAGHAVNPDFEQFRPQTHGVWRYLASLGFVQSVWTFFATPAANGPLWSLSYEFWYYVIFGAAVLIRPGTLKTVLILSAVLVAGMDILLLFPCWLAGVCAYWSRERLSISVPAARLALPVLALGSGCAVWFAPELPRMVGLSPFWFSNAFVTDWVLAAGIAAGILCFEASRFGAPAPGLDRAARWAAGHTFSLYLFHFPILAFLTAVFAIHHPPFWVAVAAVCGALALILLLSTFTEARRGAWKAMFARGWDLVLPIRQTG